MYRKATSGRLKDMNYIGNQLRWHLFLVVSAFKLLGPVKGLKYLGALPRALVTKSRKSRAVYERMGVCMQRIGDLQVVWKHVDLGILSEIQSGVYFMSLDFQMRDGYKILDAGAHVGTFAVLAGLLNPNGIIVAVEPENTNFQFLLDNIRANRLKNVAALKVALSSESGQEKLYVDRVATGTNTLCADLLDETQIVGVELVTTLSMDDLSKHFGVTKFDLAKIDIEGSEYKLLTERALERIDRLVMELHGSPGDMVRLVAKLKKLDYVVELRHGEGVFQSQTYLYAARV